MQTNPSDEGGYEHRLTSWGHEKLQDVSRTFALSAEYMTSPLKEYFSTAYLLCRIPDTIEDTRKLQPSEKSKLLSKYTEVLNQELKPTDFVETVTEFVDSNQIPEDDADWQLVFEAEKVFTLFYSFDEEIQKSIQPWVVEMTQGMRMFIERYKASEGVRIETREELYEYCYYVAGTVGHFITEIIGTHYEIETDEKLHESAEKYGLVLQVVNIAKDVYDDYKSENNVYIPAEDLDDVGVEPESIIEPSNREDVETVVTRIIDDVKSNFSQARYILKWFQEQAQDREEFTALALPYMLSLSTIRELEKSETLATEPEEVKITRDEVFKIATSIVTNPTPIPKFEERVQKGAFKS